MVSKGEGRPYWIYSLHFSCKLELCPLVESLRIAYLPHQPFLSIENIMSTLETTLEEPAPEILWKEEETKILVSIFSEPSNFKGRKILRHTWARSERLAKHKIITKFFIPNTSRPGLKRALEKEKQLFGDIVNVPVEDFLFFQTEIAVEYLLRNFGSFPFVVKVFDDSYLFIENLMNWISRCIDCAFSSRRELRSKSYTTLGNAFLISSSGVDKLLETVVDVNKKRLHSDHYTYKDKNVPNEITMQ